RSRAGEVSEGRDAVDRWSLSVVRRLIGVISVRAAHGQRRTANGQRLKQEHGRGKEKHDGHFLRQRGRLPLEGGEGGVELAGGGGQLAVGLRVEPLRRGGVVDGEASAEEEVLARPADERGEEQSRHEA